MLSLDQLTHLGGPFLHILLTTLDTAQAGDGVFVITLNDPKRLNCMSSWAWNGQALDVQNMIKSWQVSPICLGVLSQNNAFLVLYTWFDFLVLVLPSSPTTTILWLPHPEGDGQMHDILHVAMGQYLRPSKNHRFPTGFLKWASPVVISVMVIHDSRLESRARSHLAFHRGERSKWHTLLLFNIAMV